MPFYWWAFPPRLPIETANGIFTSVCCGSMTLRDGVLTFGNGQKVSYVIERDKVSPYLLPNGYLGSSDRGLVFDRNGSPLKLRLWGEPRPNRIDVTNGTTGETAAFDRRGDS